MRLLLDTHAFLWLVNQSERVSSKAREAYHDRDNEVLLSVVTVLEIQIKIQIGKLKLEDPLPTVIDTERGKKNVHFIGLEPSHVYELGELEFHHRDPFDRLLIAQARVEKANLVTHDPDIAKYAVEVLW